MLLFVLFATILLLAFPFDIRSRKNITEDDILSLNPYERKTFIYWQVLLQHLEALNPGHRISERQVMGVVESMVCRGLLTLHDFDIISDEIHT